MRGWIVSRWDLSGLNIWSGVNSFSLFRKRFSVLNELRIPFFHIFQMSGIYFLNATYSTYFFKHETALTRK